MLVAMGQVIGLDGAFEVLTGPRQITPPEGAHAEEIPPLGPSDRIMTLMVDERLAELARLVEAAALQPGEAETAENRGVHGSVELAAERKGPLVELVRSVGSRSPRGPPGGEPRAIRMSSSSASRPGDVAIPRAVRVLAGTC